MIIGICGKKGHGKDLVSKLIQYNTSFLPHKYLKDFSPALDYNFASVWQVHRFADKLKDFVCLLLNCTKEDLENREFKETPLSKEWTRWYYRHTWGPGDKGRISVYYGSEEEALLDKPSILRRFPVDAELTSELLTPRTLMQLLGTDLMRNQLHPNVHIISTFAEYLSENEYGVQAKWIIPDVRFENELKAINNKDGFIIEVHNPRIINTDEHESENNLNYGSLGPIILNDGSIEDLNKKVIEFISEANLKKY